MLTFLILNSAVITSSKSYHLSPNNDSKASKPKKKLHIGIKTYSLLRSHYWGHHATLFRGRSIA